MTTRKDSSDYLPAIFGQDAENDDLFAHDVRNLFTSPSWDLFADAAFDVARDVTGREALARHAQVKAVMKNHGKTPGSALAAVLPGAAWYEIEGLRADVQFIVAGESVWIMAMHWNARSQKVAKADALAAIYAAYTAAEKAAA